jgi:hypothetical protein
MVLLGYDMSRTISCSQLENDTMQLLDPSRRASSTGTSLSPLPGNSSSGSSMLLAPDPVGESALRVATTQRLVPDSGAQDLVKNRDSRVAAPLLSLVARPACLYMPDSVIQPEYIMTPRNSRGNLIIDAFVFSRRQ